MPWATAEIMIDEAEHAMGFGEATTDIVEQLMTSLARRVSRAPRAALLLRRQPVVAHDACGRSASEQAQGFRAAFEACWRTGSSAAELPKAIDVEEVAALLQAATMDTLVAWAATTQTPSALRRGCAAGPISSCSALRHRTVAAGSKGADEP